MNKFQRFSGRISSETCLKIDYFDYKSPKIAKRWELATPPDSLTPAGGDEALRYPFRLDDYRMCAILLSLKLLVDADDWPFFGKTKLRATENKF